MGLSKLKWSMISLALDCAALWIVIRLWYQGGLSSDVLRLHWLWFSGLFAVWLLIRYIFGLLEIKWHVNLRRLLRSLITAYTAALLAGVVYFYTQPELLLTPRRFLLAVVSVSFVLFWMAVFIGAHLRRLSEVDVYLLGGDDQQAERLARSLISGAKFRGHLNDGESFGVPRYGSIIVTGLKYEPSPLQRQVLLSARRNGARFIRLSDWFEISERRVMLEALGEFWALEFGGTRRKIYDRAKRLVDIFVGTVGFSVCLVLYLPISLGIKLSSKGNMLFIQKRVGQGGKDFKIYKFRTMRVNSGNTWTEPEDVRITSFGKFLRRWSLDELPQFWNVLKGDMSLVGPRPEQVKIAEDLYKEIPSYDERHAVKPGLSGWAQLHVYASSLEETKLKLEYDLYYVKHRSLWFDAEIILKTLAHVVLDKLR